MLVCRQHSEEAIRISRFLLDPSPDAVGLSITQARALLLNRRTLEAKQLLDTTQPQELLPAEAADYWLCRHELYWELHELPLAREAIDGIDPSRPSPPQTTWLRQLRLNLQAPLIGKS